MFPIHDGSFNKVKLAKHRRLAMQRVAIFMSGWWEGQKSETIKIIIGCNDPFEHRGIP